MRSVILVKTSEWEDKNSRCYPKSYKKGENEHPYWKVLTYLRKMQDIGPPNSILELQNCSSQMKCRYHGFHLLQETKVHHLEWSRKTSFCLGPQPPYTAPCWCPSPVCTGRGPAAPPGTPKRSHHQTFHRACSDIIPSYCNVPSSILIYLSSQHRAPIRLGFLIHV